MPQQHKWAPRASLAYVGIVYRYVPHKATDPLDGSFAMRLGGRWNPPHSFPVLYTSCSIKVAVANLWHRFEGESVAPWEVSEEYQADLYELRIDQPNLVDVRTSDGIEGLGFPPSYPEGTGYTVTQQAGLRLHREGWPGVWCRSAALISGEEVALFLELAQRPEPIGDPRRLKDWFLVPEGH